MARRSRPRASSRSRENRPRKRRILITGQGRQTEPNYFHGLKQEQDVRKNFVVKVAPGKGETPLDAVKKAIHLKDVERRKGKEFEFDEIWSVLDVEQAGKNPHLADARKLAAENGIRVVLSNPAFEVWLLAHFRRTMKPFLNCDKVVEELRKKWQLAFGRAYEKEDRDIYQRLCDRTDKAIDNAGWVRENHFGRDEDIVHCNSATEVYQIVEILLGRV
ncbi:MAG TPA: RloB family protein [Thermoguttaceae bacterium]|nr:RloB family protein [Thermoguttaceae bacterium]